LCIRRGSAVSATPLCGRVPAGRPRPS
jgi:hypothetical protein